MYQQPDVAVHMTRIVRSRGTNFLLWALFSFLLLYLLLSTFFLLFIHSYLLYHVPTAAVFQDYTASY